MKKNKLKLWLSIFWFVFTFSMVTWWWIFSLRQLNELGPYIPVEKYESLHWMLLWEGSILLAFVLGGGSALLILTSRERMQSERLRLFFSNFSHDMKTSLSRLRLRTEVFAENHRHMGLQELLEEVSRLDLQLENSLWVARGEDHQLLKRTFSLQEMISFLRVEWPEMEIHLQRDAQVLGDPAAMRSALRNILQNSWLHGQATKLEISVEKKNTGPLVLRFVDNGKGFSGDVKSLGRQSLMSGDKQGNGIGLYLTRSLVRRMGGELRFESQNENFCAILEMQGQLI